MAMGWYAVWLAATIVLTLWEGTQANILTTSMSAMGNASGPSHVLFLVWTIVFCAYFASLTGFMLVITQNRGSILRKFVYVAVAIMIFGDLMPFVPDVHPISSWLHDVCAQIASVGLCIALMLMALSIMRTYQDVFRKAIVGVLIIWGVLLGLMSIFGTKAITEMTGIIGGSVFLYMFVWWIQKATTFNASEALSAHDAHEAEEEATKLEKKASELQEEFLRAQTKARQARIVADELRKTEQRIRRKGAVA